MTYEVKVGESPQARSQRQNLERWRREDAARAAAQLWDDAELARQMDAETAKLPLGPDRPAMNLAAGYEAAISAQAAAEGWQSVLADDEAFASALRAEEARVAAVEGARLRSLLGEPEPAPRQLTVPSALPATPPVAPAPVPVPEASTIVDATEPLPYARLWKAAQQAIWAIDPKKMDTLLEVLALRSSGVTFTAEQLAERVGPTRTGPGRRVGRVAVIPVLGTISQRPSLFSSASGGTSTEAVAAAFREALADPDVSSILLDVDSPGGTVNGVPELAEEIKAARGKKPITAVANGLAASAAYWIASAADELVVSPSGEVGSIGVFSLHEDMSALFERAGVKYTLTSAGKFKTEGNPYEPLSAEAKASIQQRVDEYYGEFTRSVARFRGVSVETVRTGFGEGRTVLARQAIEAGMADRLATFDQTLARLQGG